jgi:cell division protein FtsL
MDGMTSEVIRNLPFIVTFALLIGATTYLWLKTIILQRRIEDLEKKIYGRDKSHET